MAWGQSMSDGFSAFPEETLHFLAGIAFHNSKEWLEDNRDLYEAGYIGPARRFVESLGPRLKTVAPGMRYEARLNGSISRVNRDVRFSRDKSPYKEHLDLYLWHGDRSRWQQPGLYIRITARTLYLGSGMYRFEGELVDRFRRAVVADASGRRLERTIEKVEEAGRYRVGGKTRKTVPRGYDRHHARAALLLHDGLYAGLELPAAEALTKGFPDRVLAHFQATWPIGAWLLAEVVR